MKVMMARRIRVMTRATPEEELRVATCELRDPLANPPGLWISNVPVPLTPALSRREREDSRQSAVNMDASGKVERRSAILPLPAGEGWGEGERELGTRKDLGFAIGSRIPNWELGVGNDGFIGKR
jgi:hypothetical protein